MDFFEDADEAAVVDVAFLAGEGFFGADFLEDVVEARQRDVRVLLLDPLAVPVEPLAKGAYLGFLFVGGGREGEGLEATGFVVARTIFQGASCSQ